MQTSTAAGSLLTAYICTATGHLTTVLIQSPAGSAETNSQCRDRQYSRFRWTLFKLVLRGNTPDGENSAGRNCTLLDIRPYSDCHKDPGAQQMSRQWLAVKKYTLVARNWPVSMMVSCCDQTLLAGDWTSLTHQFNSVLLLINR